MIKKTEILKKEEFVRSNGNIKIQAFRSDTGGFYS